MSWSNEAKLVFAVILCAAIISGGVMIRDTYSPQSGMTGLAADGSPTAANQPPQWISETVKFTAAQDAPLVLALNELFSDPEGNQLTYIATPAENLAVDLQDNTLAITPESGFVGERVVTITASDGKNATTRRVKVDVAGTDRPGGEVK